MPTIAEAIIERLIRAGVKRIYGVCGDSLNGFTDCIRQNKEIEWIPVRHEETAAFAAGAEAHVTNSLVVCAGSCGPGNLHLINGLYDCFRNRVPVLAIAAHIPTAEIGTRYFQETHPEHLYQECTTFCERVTSPEQLPHVLETAIQTATSLSTVSMIIISGDIALMPALESKTKLPIHRSHSFTCPADKNLEEVAQILNQANKVAIFGGAGCAGSHEVLLKTAEKLKAPIIHTLRGKEFIEYDNPFDVGMTGLLGFSSGYQAMMNCDVLLLVGTDFPYRQFYPQDAKIIQIDSRPENIGRRAPVDYGLVGDVQTTLNALNPKLEIKNDQSFLQTSLENYQSARKGIDDLAVGYPGKKPIHPQYVAKVVNELANTDAIFTCDVGTPTIWAARYLKMNGKRRLLGSFNHGSMANAVPQALGAQIAFPGRQVIAFSGDGGFSMLMGELLTLRQLKVPVKIVIFNNGAYGFVELEMKAAGILEFATQLDNPNFAKMAEAVGVFGVRVENPEDLEEGIKNAFDHPGPAIIDVVVNRLELSMPPKITLQDVYGFNLWMAKAVLDGRGSEVIDLAKTTLFRNF
ncbi:MAG: pyruvate oxidase [Chlamydiales bacterium 38-26]|nr:ubiquinone-dependent pyruvate dehydrogenase [Chlamydiales bacterium]OJV08121.1 MAG: pyruvate oxidase [Chlamydiales bacterium 38-26]